MTMNSYKQQTAKSKSSNYSGIYKVDMFTSLTTQMEKSNKKIDSITLGKQSSRVFSY